MNYFLKEFQYKESLNLLTKFGKLSSHNVKIRTKIFTIFGKLNYYERYWLIFKFIWLKRSQPSCTIEDLLRLLRELVTYLEAHFDNIQPN